MLFSSLPFLLGFLPACIAAVFLAMRFGGPRAACLVLLLASLVFYAWNTPVYSLLICTSILTNYALGRRIISTRSRTLVAIGIVFNLALLGWFKYIGLFSSTLSDIAQVNLTVDGVILPLAISFFTFQQIAYLADCLKLERNTYGILDYALFVAFFPQLIAGPIVHHRELTPQFSGPRFARFFSDDVLCGLFLFSIGLAKKVLIADSLAPLADGVFDMAAGGSAVSSVEAWAGVAAYSFQIYFDFSGYSDMALGLALMFGVKLPINFNSPYKAHSVVDFWRRWHMTLSAFLRDYLYIPLGGNRNGGISRYRNLFIVMLLGGLWHGAAWTFVVWGGLHGAYLCINHAWEKSGSRHVRISPVFATIITFTAVSVAWVFFRATSFDAAFLVFASLFGFAEGGQSTHVLSLLSLVQIAVAGVIVWRAPNAMELLERFKKAASDGAQRAPLTGSAGASVLVQSRAGIAVVTLGALAGLAIFLLLASGPYEFIYFQF